MTNANVVGNKIADGRKNKGFSQARFADLLHVTPQAVGKWERGESLPDVFMLGRIGGIIGRTDINYFLGKSACKNENCRCNEC